MMVPAGLVVNSALSCFHRQCTDTDFDTLTEEEEEKFLFKCLNC